MITEIILFVKRIVYSIIPPPYVPASYSQAGEDAVLRYLFKEKNIKKISYLELGTNVPDNGNNTYLFYKNGSRGVCVEADKTLIPIITKARPEDKILNMGVAVSSEKEADFYIFNSKGISTFDKEEAEKRAESGNFKITEIAKVELIDINTLIKTYFEKYPDFLSIDIEGLDLKVLETLDFENYPIPAICVETCTYSESHVRPKYKVIIDFMLSKGYIIYADTYINTIFVNEKWFYN